MSSISSGSSVGVDPNWLANTFAAIKASQSQGGLLGMLQNAGSNDGSVSSFLNSSKTFANNFASISQNNLTNTSSFYAQLASQAIQEQQGKALEQALADLQRNQNMVQPTNVLDDFIYFDDGSYIDTNNNILTKSDGTQIDTVTGAEVIDPAFIIQMGNGSYLNTKTSVLTLADGTKIDTITGMKVSDLEALEES